MTRARYLAAWCRNAVNAVRRPLRIVGTLNGLDTARRHAWLQSALDNLCRGLAERRGLACAAMALCVAVILAHTTNTWQTIDHLQRQYGDILTDLDEAKALSARERRQSRLSGTTQGAVSLTAMLDTLEAAWRPDIALLQWRADAGHARATAVFRATSVDAAFGLVQRLHTQGAKHARLLRQQAAERPDGQWRVEATVMVEW